ncbi:MAG: hypothetical protein ACRCY3_08215 [Sphingorhabdus sp.]
MRNALPLWAFVSLVMPGIACAAEWTGLDNKSVRYLQDDDLARHRGDADFLKGIAIAETRFRENGFDWHLLRFINTAKPDGPLWVVPHDDEDAAFEAMMTAIRRHGGVGIAVNSGEGGTRQQSGYGSCGGRGESVTACDPNRNFDATTPIFTNAILGQWRIGQPVIALHTNSPGFAGDGSGGRGHISMVDTDTQGNMRIREGGYLGNRSVAVLNDPDVHAILPYRAEMPVNEANDRCRNALNAAGVNVWHESVGETDGSLSNYIMLNRPYIAYVNFEAKRETDLGPAATAQGLMIDAYLANCSSLWNKPASGPTSAR